MAIIFAPFVLFGFVLYPSHLSFVCVSLYDEPFTNIVYSQVNVRSLCAVDSIQLVVTVTARMPRHFLISSYPGSALIVSEMSIDSATFLPCNKNKTNDSIIFKNGRKINNIQ